MATNYDINYDDARFTKVESDKSAALSDLEQTYANMINQSDKYYQAQIDASKQWADTQTKLQQEQTDFAIEQIEWQKEQAKKDYTKEQSGAYVDWQKQSNQYGANAEAMAAQGMTNTGYSESSQVSMYNTYQNRIATARESYNNAIVNYNNAIKDARLQNNAALAEIAYQALQAQLELSLEGFQYKNQLIIDQSTKKMQLDDMYYNRYQDVLQQINTENALAEEVRQYNASLAEEQRQFNAQQAIAQAQLDLQEEQFEYQISQDNSPGGSKGSSKAAELNKKKGVSAGSNKATSLNNAKGASHFSGSTYSEAVKYMEDMGVSSSDASGVMTKSEWTRRKASYQRNKIGGVEVKNYDSYQAYLKAYCTWAAGSLAK